MTAYLWTGLPVTVNTATTARQIMQSVSLLSDGTFVVVWQTTDPAQDGSLSAIKMQRFSANGTPLGAETLVNTATTADQVNPQVVGLVGGGYVVTWQSLDAAQDGSGNAIKAQIFDNNGVKIGGEFLVNSQTAANQDLPTITALSGGGFVIAWQTSDTAQDGSGTAIRAQAYSASGSAIGSEFLVNTTSAGNQTINDVVGLSNGGFVVSWSGTHTGPTGTSSEIFGQAYNPDGSTNGAEFLITNAAGNQTASRLTALADGGFAAVWTDYNLGIQAQRFDANHNPVGGQMVTASSPALNGNLGEITTLSNGDILVTWQVSGTGVYWQAFSPAGVARANAQAIPYTSGEGSPISASPVVALANAGFVVVNSDSPFSSPNLDMSFYQLNTAPQLGAATRSVAVLETSANSTTSAISISATDDGGPVAPTYSIVGGADAARFVILNPQSGQLTFATGPNFEAPTDANGDNVYEVIVRAFDGDLYDEQTILITVQNYAESPVFSTPTTLSAAENATTVTTVAAVDPEGTAVTYAIHSGPDAARFTIDSATGLLQFVTAPNYEAPVDSGANNVYNLTVSATSAGLTTLRSIAITVTNVNEAPTMASSASFALNENALGVGTVAASDPDGTALTYSIVGGVDAALFTIDAATGALSFVSAPNHEFPQDADSDNAYQVTVQASDGALSATQDVTVTVGNVDEVPVVLSIDPNNPAIFGVAEGTTAVYQLTAYDPEGAALAYSITGGADAAFFTIDALTGALSFITGQDREAPADADGDNIYDVVVTISDGTMSVVQALGAMVMNVNETPTITLPSSFAVDEGTPFVSFSALGADPDGGSLVYSLGGADAALFTINPFTGTVTLVGDLDHEAPIDADGDNVFELTVTVSDGELSASQGITIAVSNVNEAPSITSGGSFTIAENAAAVATLAGSDPDGTALSWSISGGADAALFTIDAVTGALNFISAPNHEAPGDTGADNVYDVIVSASDGLLAATQAIAVAISNVNEGQLVAPGQGFAASENSVAAGTFAASDLDGDALTYAISGGADASLFTIDALTGAVSFVTTPNYEAPTDSNGDNVYDLVITASDGSISTSGNFTISLGNVNEAPVISGSTSLSASEGNTAVATLGASDPDNGALTWSISGGADAARFTIDALTGALSFVATPDFEAPTDSDGNNQYLVQVTVSDGSLTASQLFTISLGNVNEAPLITSNGGGASASIAVTENASAVTTVTSTDPEGTARTYSIVGGADAARFTINAATGVLSFIAPPNYEAPTDAGANNVYDVIVQASDGFLTDTQALAITVGNINEAPVITSNGGGDTASVTVNENTTTVATVTSTDPEGTARTYSIVGGADAARFTINPTTGVLSFVSAPNWEAPTDAGGDNIYDVIVAASDGTLTDTQALAVTVGNVVDGSIINGTNSGNTLTGTVAEDTINGLGGNDTITGGLGADVLTGGSGADRFVYSALNHSTLSAPDRITDFSLSQNDRISLSGIDANTGLAGDQAFSWIGTGNFTNVAGQLRYYQSGGNTYVTGDVNGDGIGDFLIRIDPAVTLSASYFIL